MVEKKSVRKTLVVDITPVLKVCFPKLKIYIPTLLKKKCLLKSQASEYHNIFSQLNGSTDKQLYSLLTSLHKLI